MNLRRSSAVAFLFAILAMPAWCSFEEYLTGGRATGLDGAMTAASDDVFSLYYNPAAAARVRCPQLGAQYGRLYGGLSDDSSLGRSFIGYLQPLRTTQALGVSYSQFSLSDLYKEQTFGLSYASLVGEKLALGATVKYLRKSFGSDSFTGNALNAAGNRSGVADPIFSGGHAAGGWGADLGATYLLDHGITLGAMMMNANEPSISLVDSDSDRAPRIWKLGVARRWNDNLLTLDISHGRFTEMETEAHGGFEKWWKNGLGARVGGGIGDRDYRRITTGFSYRIKLVQFDYGFMMPFDTLKGTVGTHQLSIILRFCGLFHQEPPSALTSVLAPLLPPAVPAVAPPAPTPVPQPPAPPKKTFLLAGGAKGRVLFDTAKWNVHSGNLDEIQEFVVYMKEHPRALAEIEGHTDSVGSAPYNQKLSERRALAVMNYFVAERGIASERLTAIGYGLTQPVADNATAAGRRLNRRVIATITSEEPPEVGIER